MPQQWYYQQDGQTRGPVSREELQQLIDSGPLHKQSQVIRDGMRDWVPVSRMDLVREVTRTPPAKLVAPKTSPQSLPPRPTPSTYQQPLTRPQRPSNHLPLYFGSLAVVAILATLIGWMAHSLSSSDDDKQSEQANTQNDKRVASSKSDDRRTSGLPSRTESADSAKPTSTNELSKPASSERTQTLASKANDDSPKDVPKDFESGLSGPVGSSSPKRSEDTHPQSTDTNSDPPNIRDSPDVSGTTNEQVAEKPVTQTQPAPKQEKPLVIYQELDIQRQPTLSMLGTVIAQDIHYQILSELSVGQADEKGFRQVQQVVKDTKLLKADALSRTMFEESLKRLIGWQFSYKLNLRNEVIEIRGPDGDKKIAPVEPAGGKGFLVTSVMDEDGWKELAELSFFAPDPKGMRNQSWSRQMTHNFEPLGSWFGETTFVPRGKEQGVLRFDYAHKMTYKPPEKAAAAAGGLPFTINSADFKAGTAGGIIYFDPQLQRVHSAQEQFHVRGTLSADALGQSLSIPVEEKQAITVRIVDHNPWNNQAD